VTTFAAGFMQLEVSRRALYRESDSYASLYPISKHQCVRLGSVPNLNSQSSSLNNVERKPQ